MSQREEFVKITNTVLRIKQYIKRVPSLDFFQSFLPSIPPPRFYDCFLPIKQNMIIFKYITSIPPKKYGGNHGISSSVHNKMLAYLIINDRLEISNKVILHEQ